MTANPEQIIIVLLALIAFGAGYNKLIAWLTLTGRARGYSAFLAAFGILVTLAGAGFLIGWLPALLALACFTASGLPAAIGSTVRFMDERYRDEQAARKIAEEAISELWPNAR